MSKHYLAPSHETELDLYELPRPELDDVMQRPEAPACVSVKHDGPVTTHELPSRFGTVGQITTTATPQQVLGADRSRKRATLISVDNSFQVSITRSVIGTQTAAIWPPNVPLYITHCDAVNLSTATSAANVSYLTENWAD